MNERAMSAIQGDLNKLEIGEAGAIDITKIVVQRCGEHGTTVQEFLEFWRDDFFMRSVERMDVNAVKETTTNPSAPKTVPPTTRTKQHESTPV